MINFGIYQGLNVDIPYQDAMEQKMRLMGMERQARADAENKAKLLYDDMEFGKATSDYGQQELNKFYSERVKEIGKFVTENPDLTVNPAKMMMLKNMKRQLLDNPILLKEMRFGKERDALQEFIKKNPGVENEPEIQQMLAQVNSYNLTGRVDQANPDSEFVFLNPDMKVDLPKSIMDAFKGVQMSGLEPINGTKKDGYFQFSDDNDLYRAAQTLLSDPKVKRLIAKQYEALSDEEKQKYNGDLAKYAMELGRPYAPQKKFVPPTDGGTAGSGSGTASEKDESLRGGWQDLLESARQNPGVPQRGVADGIQKVFSSPDGIDNLSTGVIMSLRGNAESGLMTSKARDYLRTAKATPTGEIVYLKEDPNAPGAPGGYYADYRVQVPIQDFYKYFDKDAIDWGGFDNITSGVDPDESFTIHDGDSIGNWRDKDYTNLYKAVTDEKGNGYVEFLVRKPIGNASDAGYAKGYNSAAGFGTGEGNPARPAGMKSGIMRTPDGQIVVVQLPEQVNP